MISNIAISQILHLEAHLSAQSTSTSELQYKPCSKNTAQQNRQTAKLSKRSEEGSKKQQSIMHFSPEITIPSFPVQTQVIDGGPVGLQM